MPLSKKRDRERKRQIRLENKNVQPNVRYGIEERTGQRVELDADGNIVPEY